MTKTTLLTKEQATDLLKLTISFAKLNAQDQMAILEANPMYKEVIANGRVDYINNQFILTITY
jgi:hypothetical protein